MFKKSWEEKLRGLTEFLVMAAVGGFIGWITNLAAIRMIFRPHREIKILWFSIQGLVPKRRKELADSIAKTIDEQLLSVKDITAKLSAIELEGELDGIVSKIVEGKLKEELLKKIPMLAMFLNEKMMDKVKEYIKTAIYENREEFIKVFEKKLEENMDFRKIISEKIEAFSLNKLEDLILSIASKELKGIELLGGVFGALVGGVQFIITRMVF